MLEAPLFQRQSDFVPVVVSVDNSKARIIPVAEAKI
jgi:hypothetical protein